MAPFKRCQEHARELKQISACVMPGSRKHKFHVEMNAGGERSWAEMPHDILVNIMKRSGLKDKTYHLRLVCKSWLSALLDSLFPPGDVLDLRVLDEVPFHHGITKVVYSRKYLGMTLNANGHKYTKLFLSQYPFTKKLYEELAKRLPALKCVVVHISSPLLASIWMMGMFAYWPKLTEAHCHVLFITSIVHCKQIRKLCLYGEYRFIGDESAYMLANEMPQLEHLSIQGCILSPRALSIILDGQKELKHLDTRHAARVSSELLNRNRVISRGKAVDWNHDEIGPKVVSITRYLDCLSKCCPQCFTFYPPSSI